MVTLGIVEDHQEETGRAGEVADRPLGQPARFTNVFDEDGSIGQLHLIDLHSHGGRKALGFTGEIDGHAFLIR